MDARAIIKIGMRAERTLVVPPERTVGHFLPDMPMVYATPMMILEMEMASGDAIRKLLQPGWITVGTEVDIRHLAATPVGATVRTTAPSLSKRRLGVLLVLVRLEPVRSALPPSSSGSAAVKASTARCPTWSAPSWNRWG